MSSVSVTCSKSEMSIFAEFNILESAAVMLASQRDLLRSLWSSVNGEDETPRRSGDRRGDRARGQAARSEVKLAG